VSQHTALSLLQSALLCLHVINAGLAASHGNQQAALIISGLLAGGNLFLHQVGADMEPRRKSK
jgi:hypothetical protein